MPVSARLALGLVLPLFAPAAAFAGGHAPAAPPIARPALPMHAAPGPKVIQVAAKPIYGPPRHHLRADGRRRGETAGFLGYPAYYQPATEGAAHAQAAPSAETPRPRATIVTQYAGAPPLWQGDAGYVAQPVIYNVETVLRRYPLTGMEPRIVK